MTDHRSSLRLSPEQAKLAAETAEDLVRSAMKALVVAKDMTEVARAQGAISGIRDLLARLTR